MPTSNVTRFDPEAIYDDAAVYAAIEVGAGNTRAGTSRWTITLDLGKAGTFFILAAGYSTRLESDSTPTGRRSRADVR